MGNWIIDHRIEKMETEKRRLLTLKKSHRYDQLKTVNETIARLKQWNKELAENKQRKVNQGTEQDKTELIKEYIQYKNSQRSEIQALTIN
jgi:hypothetical protein